MRTKLSVLLAAAWFAVGVAGLTGCGDRDTASAAAGRRYHCPMHPTYVSDRPGDCPICNMKLVPIRDDPGGAPAPAKPAGEARTAHIAPGQFYCPMDLNVVSNAPGLCPECNMKLIEKKAESAPAPVPGRVVVSISPEKRQLIGLTLATVERKDLTRRIRTAALVEHDERRYARIAPRFAGWVRTLHANFTGAPVEKGEPLFSVYSPELFATENEYLIAWRSARQARGAGDDAAREASEALLESARLRLALFEVGDEEVRALEQRGKASSELLFRAPLSGHVLVKNAVEGKAFMAGESLFEIADLHHVWLRAFVYESDLPLVREGQDAVIRFPFLDDTPVESTVTFVYPHIDPRSRRGEVRLELDNPEHRIRPDMWANVELVVPVGERLAVPAAAVIDTGLRHVAFVDRADGHLEPREVRIGARTEDDLEVLSGLEAGERVVARALFLVDSESQLKSAIAGMTADGGHAH